MAPGKHTRFFSSNPEKQPLLPKHGSKLVLPEQMAKPYEWSDFGKEIKKIEQWTQHTFWERSLNGTNTDDTNPEVTTPKDSTLMLTPTVPESIKITALHKILLKQLGGAYKTCYRGRSGVFVEMASSELARLHRGDVLELSGFQSKLEYVAYHNTVYVCDDVQGFSTPQLFETMDKYHTTAKDYDIGLCRQRNNGPCVAFLFRKPLQDCFSFKIGDLIFTRACSTCELCDKDHEVTECEDVEMEKEITRPGGWLTIWKEDLLAWLKKLKDQKGVSWEGNSSSEASAVLEDWYNVQKLVLDDQGKCAYRYLG